MQPVFSVSIKFPVYTGFYIIIFTTKHITYIYNYLWPYGDVRSYTARHCGEQPLFLQERDLTAKFEMRNMSFVHSQILHICERA